MTLMKTGTLSTLSGLKVTKMKKKALLARRKSFSSWDCWKTHCSYYFAPGSSQHCSSSTHSMSLVLTWWCRKVYWAECDLYLRICFLNWFLSMPGLESTVASSIVSFFGVGNLLGSFTYGWVCQFDWVSPIAVNNFTIFALGVSMLCLPQSVLNLYCQALVLRTYML